MSQVSFTLDLSQAPLVITTSGTDSFITIPTNNPYNTSVNPRLVGSWWLISVEGGDVYMKQDAVATAAAPAFTVGVFSRPYRLKPGCTMHAIQVSAAGKVSFLPCYSAE